MLTQLIVLPNLAGETWNAIIVAVGGSISAFLLARFQAKRDNAREDVTEGRAFRGELRDDNQALRAEVREVKSERDRLVDRLAEVEEELYKLQAERRTRQKADKVTERRQRADASPDEIGPIRSEREARQAADLATDVRQNEHFSDPEGARNPTADAIVKKAEQK